jgi:DNA-binding response OmpR family regulator
MIFLSLCVRDKVPRKVCDLLMILCRGVDFLLTKILVVEDEKKIARIIKEFLLGEGYQVTVVEDGLTALTVANEIKPAVVLLDWMLPQLNGIEVCRKLREIGDFGIIMLTAKAEETDKIIGLGVGADDYMTKPFSLRELAARIQSLLRRLVSVSTKKSPMVRSFGALTIWPHSHRVMLHNQELTLTPTEYKILDLLSAFPEQVFSREQLLQHVFPEEKILDIRTIDAHISRLRRKLHKNSDVTYIHTVYGFGYRFGVSHED